MKGLIVVNAIGAKVLERIRHLRDQRRIDGQRPRRAHQQRLPIRRRFGDKFRPDDTTGAGTIIDNYRLAERLGKALAENAARSNPYRRPAQTER